MEVKNQIPAELKKGVVYEIPCQNCNEIYVGETGQTLNKRISKYKLAVRWFNDKNGIAVYMFKHDHYIN